MVVDIVLRFLAVVFVDDQLRSAAKGIGTTKLPFLEVERNAGIALAARANVVAADRQVTPRDFLNIDAQYVCFQGHATYDAVHPDETALHFLDNFDNNGLIDDESDVHMADVFYALRWPRTLLVALSACDAGAADSSLSTMPVALLHGGVKSVLAAAWRVDDDFACCFMTRFHWHLFVERQSVAVAFSAAQTFARCATGRQWISFLSSPGLRSAVGVGDLQQQCRNRCKASDVVVFSAPKHWAAFRLFGTRSSASDALVIGPAVVLPLAVGAASDVLVERLAALSVCELRDRARLLGVGVASGLEKRDVARRLLGIA